MARAKFIADPSEPIARQEQLFNQPGFKPRTLKVHPDIDRSIEGLRHVLQANIKFKGIDLEFDTSNLKPTIVSVTLPTYISSVKWSDEVADMLRVAFLAGQTQWVAHSGISADKPVVEKWCGIQTDLVNWEDSMITHYMCNMHLCKSPSKEESDDAGALGFMNLWAMASLTTDMYNWKACRGVVCEGPCPAHDPIGYCGVDSWAGLWGFTEHQETMKHYGVTYEFYREQMELAEICWEMELAGVKVDVTLARELDAQADVMKDNLFEFAYPPGAEEKAWDEARQVGLKREEDIKKYVDDKLMAKRRYALFNPRAPLQTTKWFEEHGIKMKSTQKAEVLALVEDRLKEELGILTLKEFNETPEVPEPSFVLQQLLNVYTYKSEGKGLDPWFADKYLSKDGFLHPRFIPVGASTGRLSSSGPNLMNVPARGFGALVRRCIIPRSPELELLKADYGQLELRMCLYQAGVEQSVLGKDAFIWLVEESDGAFLKAAESLNPKGYAEDAGKAARDVSKRISHAGDYLEGFQLLTYEELGTARIKREIEVGARRVYLKKYYPALTRDWTFMGKVVSFTGVNLGIALFGDKSYESRKKALEIQEDIYFKRFWFLREWHMKVTDQIENQGYLKTGSGAFLKLFGRDEDRAKVAVAGIGQGESARHVQAIMRKYKRETGRIPLIQVHDELVWEIMRELSDKKAMEFVEIMRSETPLLPGFWVPTDAKRGPNWKDLKSIVC